MKRTLATVLAVVGFAGVAVAQDAPGAYGVHGKDAPAATQNVRIFDKDPTVTSSTERFSVQYQQDAQPRFRWNEN